MKENIKNIPNSWIRKDFGSDLFGRHAVSFGQIKPEFNGQVQNVTLENVLPAGLHAMNGKFALKSSQKFSFAMTDIIIFLTN